MLANEVLAAIIAIARGVLIIDGGSWLAGL